MSDKIQTDSQSIVIHGQATTADFYHAELTRLREENEAFQDENEALKRQLEAIGLYLDMALARAKEALK